MQLGFRLPGSVDRFWFLWENYMRETEYEMGAKTGDNLLGRSAEKTRLKIPRNPPKTESQNEPTSSRQGETLAPSTGSCDANIIVIL